MEERLHLARSSGNVGGGWAGLKVYATMTWGLTNVVLRTGAAVL